MKRLLLSVAVAAVLSCLYSCSGSDYIANPTTNANNSANPLDPLDTNFDWGGDPAFSAKIDGTYWHADSVHAFYNFDTLRRHVIYASDGSTGFTLYLAADHAYTNNTYNFGFGNVSVFGLVYTNGRTYTSTNGNAGQVRIIRNDATRIIGKFYFQSVDTFGKYGGNVVNISEGYFNVHKW